MARECKMAKKVWLVSIPHSAVGISPYSRIPIFLYSDIPILLFLSRALEVECVRPWFGMVEDESL